MGVCVVGGFSAQLALREQICLEEWTSLVVRMHPRAVTLRRRLQLLFHS